MSSDFTTFLKIVNRDKALSNQSFALTLYIPHVIDAHLQDIRQRYDPASVANIPVHITIKRFTPFLFLDDVEQIIAELTKLSKEIKPFEVALEGYGTFRSPNRNVAFLNIKDPEPLRQLHQKVIATLSAVFPDGGADSFEGAHFTPHVTIGNAMSDLDLAVLEYELANNQHQLKFTFEVNQMSLVLAFFQRGGWEIKQTFKFEE